ncbi:multidrug efflux RND transporter permease subunit [Pigmentiphaga litoralis]|jgi:hydrophobe/amphiphile efflux-1 (HAE1) family protein|uniref:efflux RND transporter permease subunit n=1 Tax=Pigmentiphaga litoralis TaxID=516702 RepID=UPI001678C619|nr:efflux RND transporter permease subunit [Pigmentiphaga litoralis]GGX10707.1 multidrug efflux RND transporter permease subunit [Pigmentiphaga litoralis]
MSQFFINRPIFAWVVALFIILGGILAIPSLPISQYPAVAPPSITVSAIYPGASADTVDKSIVSLIEDELNGATGMLYFESTSTTGQAEINVTFAPGTNPDLAAVDVQNRIKRVESRLPQSAQQQGIRVEKASTNFLMVVTLSSKEGDVDVIELGDYLTRNVLSEIRRVPGIGRAQLFASQRAMRVWIDPVKLRGYNLSASDVNAAIAAQNVQVTAGAIGDQPSLPNQQISSTIIVKGQLVTAEEFSEIVLRANPDGSTVRVRDVARVEIGAESYQFSSRLNGKPTAAIAVQLSPGANALSAADGVQAKLKELSARFPQNYVYATPYDTSPFVRVSIEKVIHTLLEAMVLVFLVMFLFLQNIRYTLIPSIVVPIALMGTFAVMLVAGFSINVLTMFGMVLAIGILVDDAIVVVENVERIMASEGLSPKEATKKAMTQISGAIVGITLVLTAVFLPLAFMGGSVGVIYQQFSLSMAASILFSGFLALSLTPALCATLLKPVKKGHHDEKKGFFGWFNRKFDRTTDGYQNVIGRMLGRTGLFMIVYAGIVAILVWTFISLPSSFLPAEDQGYLITDIQTPPGASFNRTRDAVEQVEQHYLSRPSVASIITILGFSFSGRGQNAAISFATFKDWSERGPEESAAAEAGRGTGTFMGRIKDAMAFSVVPPAITELGNATGFALRLQDRGGLGHDGLLAARNQLMAAVPKSPVLAYARVEGLEDAPQLQLVIDRVKANALGVTFGAITSTLSTTLGSSVVNDFTNNGRVQRVVVQGEPYSRTSADDILKLNAPNTSGGVVPLSAFAKVEWQSGPVQLVRYNGYGAYKISGDAKPGYSSGEAMAEMERLIGELPPGIGYEWTGQSLQERVSGSQVPILLGLSLLVVFLVLAALYESWSIPVSVMLVVPLGVIGAVLAVTLRGMPNDVFFKVGLITIIGLSAKNAILIVEFAKDLYAEGKGLVESTLEASRLRFRPILMTSLAFILGVLPLAIATGASSGAQRAIGTGVIGGMISATILAVFFVPVFFVVTLRLFKTKQGSLHHDNGNIDDTPPAHGAVVKHEGN